MLHICISYMFFKMHKLPLMYPIFSWNAWWFSKYIDHSYLYWFSMMYWTTNLKVNSVLDREPSLLVKSIYFDKFQQIFRNKSRVSKNVKFSCFDKNFMHVTVTMNSVGLQTASEEHLCQNSSTRAVQSRSGFNLMPRYVE